MNKTLLAVVAALFAVAIVSSFHERYLPFNV